MILVAPDHIESATGRLLKKSTAAAQNAISGKYAFSTGDVIYSKIRPYLQKVILADFDGLCSADMYPLTPRKGNHGGFILAVMLSERFTQFAKTVSMRSGMPKINREELAQYTIAVPASENEQRSIAAALGAVDALLAGLDRLIAKKRDLKQAAMQQLLTGQTRLPGFIGEWETKHLGEIGDSLIGLTYRPSDVRSHGTLVLRSSNVQEGVLCFDDNVFVDVDVNERIMVRTGDILICVRNGSRDLIGKCAKIGQSVVGMTFGAFMAVFRTPFHNFVFHQFQSDVIKRQISAHLGATINQITNRSLNSFEIRIPRDAAEQEAIAGVLSDMDGELAALEARRAKTAALKQGMMQELLTGRTRLV
jgi:type I restriction enzyme S subunit